MRLSMKMVESKDYELIVHDSVEDAWAIRILTGDFVETVLKFGAISLNEFAEHISFNFTVLESPDETATTDNEDLQFVCARILEDVIMRGMEDGSVGLTDRETGSAIEY